MSDYHAYKNSIGGSGGGGCFSWKAIVVIAIIYELLKLLGKCSG